MLLVVFQSSSVNGPRPNMSMLSPWMATTLLVSTTRFTDSVALTLPSTLRVPSSAGLTSCFSGSRILPSRNGDAVWMTSSQPSIASA